MASKDEKKVHHISDGGPPPPAEDLSLEEILTEFGGGLERLLLGELADSPPQEETVPIPAETAPVPAETPPAPAPPPKAEAAPSPETEPEPVLEPEAPQGGAGGTPEAQAESETESGTAPQAEPAPEAPPEARIDPEILDEEGLPHPVSLEEMVGSTVEAVLEERPHPAPPPPKAPRLGLFSRRRLPEEDELPEPPPPEPEPIPPEPSLFEASAAVRLSLRRQRGALPAAFLIALVLTLFLILERYGKSVPFWTGQPQKQTVILLACLAAETVLCRSVFAKAVRMVREGRLVSELLASLSVLASAADCALRLGQPARTDAAPYAAVSCLALAFSLWGNCRETQGLFETFRTAALDEDPPYLVTETKRGACKQRGALPGFYTAAMRSGGTALWQTAALPVALAATVVFAGLTSLGQDRGADFFLNWSALLSAAATFSLPLCWGLPFSQLASHLQKAGCAVAGWTGAEKISRGRSMVLTDADLFPPGTVAISEMKIYNEELQKAASYAATMARAAGSGLERVFDGLLREEAGEYAAADDFGFYQEGGWSAVINGEDVLMGTAPFLARMGVRLPSEIRSKTGIYLAADKTLLAVFTLKYAKADNVDFALEMMLRGRVTPILASRDPNITPSLLKRRFNRGVRVEFPSLSARVALSEAELNRGLPRALVLREGLLPYADTVVGSRRLCRAVRQSAALSLLGSAAGILLTYYLTGIGAYALLTPLALELFLLLWTLPVLVIANLAGRY